MSCDSKADLYYKIFYTTQSSRMKDAQKYGSLPLRLTHETIKVSPAICF